MVKISALNDEQRGHLIWRIDAKTGIGLITAGYIAKGHYGDKELVEVFREYGGMTLHQSKIHARKVINYSLLAKEKIKTGFDPTGCQAAIGIRQLDYIANQVDAKKRLKQGQQQAFCGVCQRWRWPDARCPEFSPDKK